MVAETDRIATPDRIARPDRIAAPDGHNSPIVADRYPGSPLSASGSDLDWVGGVPVAGWLSTRRARCMRSNANTA